MAMRLFILRLRQVTWGTMHGVVVRAESVAQARALAAESAYGEGAAAWRDRRKTTCEELLSDGEAGVVLTKTVD